MTLITNNTVKVFQMQCSNIKKLENDRGLILERKYDLLCRNIANGEVISLKFQLKKRNVLQIEHGTLVM